jgi:hypothetical protein
MQAIKRYPAGTFSWVDLATTDGAAAKTFYGDLFGWQFEDMPAGPGMIYTMATLNGLSVAGLYQMGPQQAGLPPFWKSYVTVENADQATQKAATLGGTIVMPPMDVPGEAGRMADIQDPTGALFAIWQPGQHIGAGVLNVPNAVAWNELSTHDTAKAAVFYAGLFGWTSRTQDMGGGMLYTTFSNQGHYAGGMMAIQPEWGEMPSTWVVYFGVEDCQQAVEKAAALGGTIALPPTTIEKVGVFAMLQDPQGAFFAVISMNEYSPTPESWL